MRTIRLSAISRLVLALVSVEAQSPGADFDAFVKRYSDEWMRFHSNAASIRRYFKGPEQEAFERQIEPVTRPRRAAELQLIRTTIPSRSRRTTASTRISSRS
jgi:hypothetical protein